MTDTPVEQVLLPAFGSRVQINAPLARFTAARVGGTADVLLEVRSQNELTLAACALWEHSAPFVILGGGSNVLVSDMGVRAVVLVNRARRVRFIADTEPPKVWAESGANFGSLARQAAQRGLSGLEWAAGIPGTVGGAVVGNAGAHGSDMTGTLLVAEILHRNGEIESWPVEKLGYSYRSSVLKQHQAADKNVPVKPLSPDWVVLKGLFGLERSTAEAAQGKIEIFVMHRRRTQPPGASMGSMFKNPPGDYAGRLIESAGLKGRRIGDAQISSLHANFFINLGQARAADIWQLISLAQKSVQDNFGVNLDLEIELLGEW